MNQQQNDFWFNNTKLILGIVKVIGAIFVVFLVLSFIGNIIGDLM